MLSILIKQRKSDSQNVKKCFDFPDFEFAALPAFQDYKIISSYRDVKSCK